MKSQSPKKPKPLFGAEYVGCFYETGYNSPSRPANALVANSGTFPPPTTITTTNAFVYPNPNVYPFQGFMEFKTTINPVTATSTLTTYESCIQGCQVKKDVLGLGSYHRLLNKLADGGVHS